jgi:hypothetical protein
MRTGCGAYGCWGTSGDNVSDRERRIVRDFPAEADPPHFRTWLGDIENLDDSEIRGQCGADGIPGPVKFNGVRLGNEINQNGQVMFQAVKR